MDVDFNQPMLNAYGQPIEQDGEPLLLGHVCVNALNAVHQGDKRSGTEKIACWKMSQSMIDRHDTEYGFRAISIKAKEITMLQDLIEKIYPSPTIYAQACEMLEPEKVGQ